MAGRRLLRRLQRPQEAARPAVHIVATQPVLQNAVAGHLFPDRFGQSPVHGIGDFVLVVRVDQKRFPHLLGCSGQFAQGERRRLIGPAGHKFLGHQIHPVAQGSDQGHVASPVQRHQFVKLPVPALIEQRGPTVAGESALGENDRLLQFPLHRLVGLHPVRDGAMDNTKTTRACHSGWRRRNSSSPRSRVSSPVVEWKRSKENNSSLKIGRSNVVSTILCKSLEGLPRSVSVHVRKRAHQDSLTTAARVKAHMVRVRGNR